jgi:hypothetical protein
MKDFAEECTTCKDHSIQYYWTKPCSEIQPCLNGGLLCSCDENCPDGLSCDQGKCVNKCLNVKCWPGSHCVKGICVEDQPVDNCAAVLCHSESYCVNGKCVPISVDPCANIYCIATATCIGGKCVPLDVNVYGI